MEEEEEDEEEAAAVFDLKTLFHCAADRKCLCINVHVVLRSERLIPDWVKPNIRPRR